MTTYLILKQTWKIQPDLNALETQIIIAVLFYLKKLYIYIQKKTKIRSYIRYIYFILNVPLTVFAYMCLSIFEYIPGHFKI